MGGGGGGGGGGGPIIPPPQFIFKSAPDERTGIVSDVYQNYLGERVYRDPNWKFDPNARRGPTSAPFIPFEGRHPNEQAKIDNERYIARRKERENRVRSARSGGRTATNPQASKIKAPSAAFEPPGENKKTKNRINKAFSSARVPGGGTESALQATLGTPTLLGR